MSPRGYSGLQIALHWIIAALIVVQLTVNLDMQQAFAQRLAGTQLPTASGAWFHAVVGLMVLALALLRLGLRLIRGVPKPPAGSPSLVNLLSHATHLLLYGFLFFMPLTGALAWFGGVQLAGILHEVGRLVLIPAIFLHLGGAIIEELVLRHPVLRRMLRPGSA